MAKKALIEKQKRAGRKFGVRAYTRCARCGRARAVYRKYLLCRLCFRQLSHQGEIPGVTKASW